MYYNLKGVCRFCGGSPDVHDANAPDFTTWFDYDGVVISKVV